ncbi:hypothetical protein [Niveispirillum sp. KHB5.9]|uniref:hypothetical protein n=1 Tax=Niveispirillum sp. KHB5.9 TaxID=3400269 RepID=UPI003A839229
MLRSIAYLRHSIVAPALAEVADVARLPHFASEAAIDLVMATAAAESEFSALHQVGGGPALGLWQIEPRTAQDIWVNYLDHRVDLAKAVRRFLHTGSRDQQLASNLAYGAIACRAIYLRRPEPLPRHGDIPGYAAFWKAHYNTPQGKGVPAEFEARYARLIAPTLKSEF